MTHLHDVNARSEQPICGELQTTTTGTWRCEWPPDHRKDQHHFFKVEIEGDE